MTKEQENFLKQVAGLALESERVFGIPACVTIAQATIESAGRDRYGIWHWGGNKLFREANNPFGIKNRDLPNDYGEYVVATPEYNRGDKKSHTELLAFEKFRSLADAFRAHAGLISKSLRYLPAMQHRSDWRKFAEALGPKTSDHDAEHCGYATDPNYGQKLIGIVERYKLSDPLVLSQLAGPPEAGAPVHAVEGVDV